MARDVDERGTSPERFDAIVVGAGQAGPGVAIALAGEGQRVALVEGDTVGGTCLNRGCRPTKALRASARVAHLSRTAVRHGVITGAVTVDVAAAMARKDALLDGWVDGLESGLATAGLDLVRGWGRFAGRDGERFRVVTGGRTLAAPHVFLDVGTRASEPSIPGLADVDWLDNDRVLQLTTLPERLVVIGGGYVGLEFAQIFRRFGSEVTIIQRGERVAAREDDEIAAEITRFLEAEGIVIRTRAAVARVEPIAPGRLGGVRVHLHEGADGGGPVGAIEGTHLLVAVGRTPNTDRLALDTVGLETDGRGLIRTDGQLRTAVEGIWALGDINGRGAFTHTAYADHEVVLDALRGGRRTADGRIPTYAVFTDPPLGRVGMNEREARASGRAVLKASMPLTQITRAQLDGETDGVFSILVDADTDEILGAATLGLGGDEIIQQVSALMHAGAPSRVLTEMMPIHPTVAEFWPTILRRLAPLG